LVLERRFRVNGRSNRPNTDSEILASQHFGDYSMKKTQLALAAVALVASSAAISANVSISGNLDVAVARTSGYNGTGGMFLDQGAYFDHQGINFNVSEDLGSGLKAHGSLGAGFNANGASDNPGANRGANGVSPTSGAAGVMDNGLFNRQSYVGLSGEFGDVRLGRQLSPFIAAAAGNMHYVGMFGVGRLFMAGDENVVPGVAAGSTAGGFFRDDAIQYTTPSLSGFTGNLMTTMRNSTNNNNFIVDRGRYSAFSVSGPIGSITVNAAYHAQRYTGAANAAAEYSGYAIGGMAPIADGLSLSAGMISTIAGSAAVGTNDQRTDSWNVGLGYDLSSSNKVLLNYASSNRFQNAANPEDATLMNVMLVNSLSARTKLYAAAGWGNRIGATIGTIGVAQTGAGVAAANGPTLNANDANATRNNAVVFGVAHSF